MLRVLHEKDMIIINLGNRIKLGSGGSKDIRALNKGIRELNSPSRGKIILELGTYKTKTGTGINK